MMIIMYGVPIIIAVLLGVGWWGAGVILYPPHKSGLTVFPEQFGLRYEKVSFQTEDGLTLRGWFIPSPTGDDRTILMGHGWGDNKGELLKISHFLNSTGGFNLLYFDNRAHGESDGNITTIGCLEIMDFKAAMAYLRRHRPQSTRRLGVFGLSMGAAVAIMAAPQFSEIKALVLESPFADYRQVVRRWAWINLYIPYFPQMMVVLWLLRHRVGSKDVDSYSPSRFISRLSPRPILVIGAEEDRLMPASTVRSLYALAQEPKSLWMIPGAAHAECREIAGDEYDRRVIEFFRRHL